MWPSASFDAAVLVSVSRQLTSTILPDQQRRPRAATGGWAPLAWEGARNVGRAGQNFGSNSGGARQPILDPARVSDD